LLLKEKKEKKQKEKPVKKEWLAGWTLSQRICGVNLPILQACILIRFNELLKRGVLLFFD